MADSIGLSVGATRFAGVQLRRGAVTRASVHGAVERVGDPVPMVAVDGSVHRGELLVADALRELLYTVTDGRPPADPAAISYPAHWRRAAVDALRTALTRLSEWSTEPIQLIPDTATAICALQSDPGVPSRGVIALCDFGGTGASVTLLDASRGYMPLGPTLRHPDFSGDWIDQALLTHVVADLSVAAVLDASGTSALGPLHRLRAQCRAAKERLSSAAVTALTAELPSFHGDVRVTRTELDELVRRPLSEFVGVVQDTLRRNGVRPSDLVAVASVGGGARIPIVTTTLSEHFRVPVITSPRPELAAADGAALRAAWGPADDRSTAVAPAPVAAAFADADAHSGTFRALAWSEPHDVLPLAPPAEPTGASGARPEMEFDAADEPAPVPEPAWYRRGSAPLGVAATVVMLLAVGAVVAFGGDNAASTTSPRSPSAAAPGTADGPAPTGAPAPPPSQDPPRRTVYVAPPPVTHYQAPATQYRAPAPPPASPAPAAPTPSSEPPPPPVESTTPPAPTSTVTEPPPSSEPPPTPTPTPPVTFTFPPIPPIPDVLNPPQNP